MLSHISTFHSTENNVWRRMEDIASSVLQVSWIEFLRAMAFAQKNNTEVKEGWCSTFQPGLAKSEKLGGSQFLSPSVSLV